MIMGLIYMLHDATNHLKGYAVKSQFNAVINRHCS